MKNYVLKFLGWVLAGGLLLHGLHAQDAREFPPEFFKKEITARIITGNISVEELQRLNALDFWSQVGKKNSLEKLQHDMASIYAQGFIAQISAKPVLAANQRELWFMVTANPVISQIVFEGLQSLSPSKLLDKTRLKLGRRLNYQDLAADIQEMNQKFIKEGYELSYVKKSSFDENSQTLIYQIHETRIGEISLRGNTLHPSEYLLREIWAKAGDVFNTYRLRDDRFVLLKLGYLQGVSNANILPTAKPEVVDVYFNVVEQKSNTLQLGLGYSNLDDNRFVFSNLNLLNILGGGETITLRFQLGLKKVNDVEASAFTYRLRYSNMLIPEYKIVGAVENYLETGPENLTLGGTVAASAVDIKRQATLAELTVPFSPRTKLITSIRFLDVLNNNPNAAALGVTVVGYKKNSLIGIFRYEDVKRDAYQNAFSGLLGVLRAEKSFGLALGDGTLPFEKYDASSTFYSPLWSEQDVLMFNLAAGQVSLPANQIVAEGELYKMGGPSTVRGYFSQSPFAIGSKKLQFNLEWRHIFNEVFSSLVFYDYGGAYDSDLFTNLSTLLGSAFGYGFGAGLRANTPVGSMELTLAQNKNGQQLIHISLGATF